MFHIYPPPRNPENSRTTGVSDVDFSQSSTPVQTLSTPENAKASGALDFKANESKEIEIDGKTYILKNKQNSAQSLSYIIEDSGKVTFISSYFTIEGKDKDVAYDLEIQGVYNSITTGNKDDTIFCSIDEVTGGGNSIYGGAGNDTITSNGRSSNIYGAEGDDTITISQSDARIYGGSGNDTFYSSGINNIIYGGDGDDSFTQNGSSSRLKFYGEGGNDEFSILSSNSGNTTIDGGEGTNRVLVDNGYNTIKVNVENPNAYSVNFSANETKDILINGIKYTVQNISSGNQTFIYRIDGNTIEFLSSNFHITGEKEKAHDVKLSGSNCQFTGGNLADKIVNNNSSNTIYAGAGNDTIDGNQAAAKIYGEDGDDVISNRCSYFYTGSVIDGGNGNDILNIENTSSQNSNNTYYTIKGGAGDDTFNLKGSNILVEGNDGDDIFNVISGTNCMIMGGSGKNTIQDNGTDTSFSNMSNATSNLTELKFSSKNETKTVTIGGKQYTITNQSEDGDKTLAYFYNEATGEITFTGNEFEIRGSENQQHNLIINGEYNTVYGGKQEDKINIKGIMNKIYAGAGNDTVIHNGWLSNDIYGEEGNDEIILNYRNDAIVDGGEGDDTITLKEKARALNITDSEGDDTYNIYGINAIVNGSLGNNIFNITGDNNVINGGSGNDSFTVTGSGNSIRGAGGDDYNIILGSNNNIDGGTGLNYYVDSGSNNTYSNVSPDPNSQTIVFVTQNQTEEIILNGKKYTFINTNHDGTSPASNKVTYVYNPNTGEMNIIGSNITLICDDSSSNDIKLYGDNNVIQGGSKNDTISVESGSGNYIHGNDGNDNIIMNSDNNHLFGNSGNDSIIVNGSNGTNEIDAGDGNDTITINSDNNTAISTGSGNDTLNINGDGNKNIAGTGSEKINISGSNNEITTSDENNNIRVSGSDNTVTSGTGSDEIVVSGTGNALNDNGGDNKINISGNDNSLQAGSGSDSITIKGDNNTANAGDGDDTITVSGNENIMTGQGGDDSFIVNGGQENNLDGNDGYNTMLNYGINTIYQNVHDITPDGVRFQIGANSDAASSITIDTSLYIGEFTIDFSSTDSAAEAIETVDALMEKLQSKLAQFGAAINRLNSALESQTTQIQNLTASRSTIMDADIAQESADYVKNQILQQTSSTLLAQSQNLHSSIVLSLIQ